MAGPQRDIARTLAERTRGGDDVAELVSSLYDELRALARRYLSGERPDHTLQPTALVHEAYLRMVGHADVDWKGKTHFLAVAATQMRRILVDHARKVAAGKRGGPLRRVTLLDSLACTPNLSVEFLDLDDALTRLAKEHPRQASVAELRLFSGMLVKETAYRLGVSERTVKCDWRFARAWLLKEIQAA
jgi:RNA polymerase sigma factor (TIGR02999 family)